MSDKETNNDENIENEVIVDESIGESSVESHDEETSVEDVADDPETVEVEEKSTIDLLAELMVDSADSANNAASSANLSSEQLVKSVSDFNDNMALTQKRMYIIFWVFTALMVVAIAVSGVLVERLTQSASQADEIMLTVGKRVIQMDNDLQRLKDLRKELEELNETNKVLVAQVGDSLFTMNAYEEAAQKRHEDAMLANKDMFDRAASRMEVKFAKLASTTTELDDKIKRHSIELAKLGDEVIDMAANVAEMKDTKLLKKLDALIKLEQNRYYEQMNQSGRTAVPTAEASADGSEMRYPLKSKESIEKSKDCNPILGVPCE